MHVTELGILKLTKDLQFSKALVPICVTESGMVKLAKEVQFLNAPVSI